MGETDGVLTGTRHQGQEALINSNGVNTTAAVPSENGRSNRRATRPSGSGVNRSVATGGRAR
jgi:hypothetical protein